MTAALAPASWWRGLGGLTRSGSSVEGLSWALYDFANTIYLIVRGVPEGVTRSNEDRLADEATLEPAVAPPGELPG